MSGIKIREAVINDLPYIIKLMADDTLGRERENYTTPLNQCYILAKDKNCSIVQLTSNKTRKDAHRFYERLGFHATHEGMKLSFES